MLSLFEFGLNFGDCLNLWLVFDKVHFVKLIFYIQILKFLIGVLILSLLLIMIWKPCILTLLIEVDWYVFFFALCLVSSYLLQGTANNYKSGPIGHPNCNCVYIGSLSFAWFLSFSYHIHKCVASKVCTALLGKLAWHISYNPLNFGIVWSLSCNVQFQKVSIPTPKKVNGNSKGEGSQNLKYEGIILEFQKG